MSTKPKDLFSLERYYPERSAAAAARAWHRVGTSAEQLQMGPNKTTRLRTGLIHPSVAQFIEPVLVDAYGQPASSRHIVVVAHGIFNSEIRTFILSFGLLFRPLFLHYTISWARSRLPSCTRSHAN